MKRIEIKRSKDRQYYFIVLQANNKIIATSETYKQKLSCQRGIRSLQSFFIRALLQEPFTVIDKTKTVKK